MPEVTNSLNTAKKLAIFILTPIGNVLCLMRKLPLITAFLAIGVILVICNPDSFYSVFLGINFLILCLVSIGVSASEHNPEHTDGIWVVIGVLILLLAVSINLLLTPFVIENPNINNNPFSDVRIAHTAIQICSFVWAPIGASIIAGSIVSIRTSTNNQSAPTSNENKFFK